MQEEVAAQGRAGVVYIPKIQETVYFPTSTVVGIE
jgi:hypothetical protein